MALIRKYRSRVVSIEQPLEGIYVVVLESLEKKYKFKPGQFLHLALDRYDPAKAWPDSRCFSIQSPPEESRIKITFSKKGLYTERMSNELAQGREVTLKLPYGDLFQKPHEKKNCVFIAGGTGITPFLSLFNDNSFTKYRNVTLYFGVRNANSDIYQDEFDKARTINPSLKVQVINQETDGIIDIKQIINENSKNATYFISGPPEMIKLFKKTLVENSIYDIRTDDWG
jgi:predicted ferric reductase